jgi:SAM-dependent methyltransferase
VISRFINGVRTYGFEPYVSKGIKAVFRRPWDSFQVASAFVAGRKGLEIGGPSVLFKTAGFPLYAAAGALDNCNYAGQTIWSADLSQGQTFHFHSGRAPGHQFLCEAQDLKPIESANYDFVIASHTLEHVANPIKALHEWQRVTKPGGAVIVILPHRDGTFDHRRPITTLEHIRADHRNNVAEDDRTHVEEILRLHDVARDPGVRDFAEFKQRSEENLRYRALHHHVFNTALAVDLVADSGLRVIAAEAVLPFHIIVIAQKAESAGAPIDAIKRAALASSPFPSDKLAPT